MYGSSPSVSSITDSQGGVYEKVVAGANGSVYMAVYRRTSPLADSSSSFTVAATPSASVPIEMVAIEVWNDGGVDTMSSVHSGTGTSETSSVATSVTNDLVLFLGADNSGSGPSWGSGQTGIMGYPATPPPNVTAWGSYQSQVSPGTANSTRTISTSKAWVAASIAVSPQVPWSALAGKPFVTVSSIGTLTTPASTLPNNGADFGPDTPLTATSGIQEALNAVVNGGTVYIQGGTYTLNGPISQTGSYQVVNFEAGTTLQIGSMFPTSGLGTWAGVIIVGWNLANTEAYHHCYWYGNGTVLNLSGIPNNVYGIAIVGNGPMNGGPSPAPFMLRVDGFEDLRKLCSWR